MDRSGEIFQSITAEFIYWIVDRHSGLPNVLSISMARCVLAQRIPTVGIWRYVVDVPGSVNRSGGQIALYKTGSLHSYWAAGVWHLPAYVCVYAWTSCPRYGIPTVGIFVCGRVRRCFWELPVPTISAKWRSWSCPPSISIITSSYREGFCLSVPASHTHISSVRCLIFSGGLSLLIPGNRSCRGSRYGIFRAWWQEKRSRFPQWELGSSNMFSVVKEWGRAVVLRSFRTLSARFLSPSCPLPFRAICSASALSH